MKTKGKYIGVESRIPYDLLESVVIEVVCTGVYDKTKCLDQIKVKTTGENRAKKILKHISVFVRTNELILNFLYRERGFNWIINLTNDEKKALILCLFCNGFPIAYDIIIGISQVFKVQSSVSKEVIKSKIGSIYGSNRAMDIAITEILPLLLACKIIKRIKMGVYTSTSQLKIGSDLITELIVYTDINQSKSKSILIDDVLNRPWYLPFEVNQQVILKPKYILRKQDSSIGRGYISMKKLAERNESIN